MLSPAWLDELRSRVTLSSVIMRTTKLQRAGREWKACCPFHNEKTPSFTVNDEKGFYHCFGCQAHGDVIRWMTDQRGLQFMDAVKELAAEAGMEVPAADPRSAERAEKRAGLHDVMQAAQDWFVRNLQDDLGSGARDYLATRGFSQRTIERFGFGYAPADRQALKAALGQFEEAMLIEGGLRITVEGKEPYDRFRSRLMLPIHDARGRVIAFGGRILEADTKAPKYLNSPDTPLFDKGRTLYNLHRAGPVSRQSGRMVVVEGYMDVIALADAGIEDAVAPLGTALTENQIELLWRTVERPILCFDGDAAGQRAAMRAILRILPLLRPSHSFSIVRLTQGFDPDDLIKAFGPEAMEELLSNASSLIDAIWEFERDANPLRTPEDKAGLKARLVEHTEAILDPDIRGLYRRELLERYSNFAFPSRSGFNKKVDIQDLSQSSALRLWMSNYKARQEHLHKRLGAAIAAGLTFWPQKVHEHSEILIKIDPTLIDPRINIFLEYLPDSPRIERGDAISLLRGFEKDIPHSREWDYLAFPFTLPQPPDESRALKSLDMAIKLYQAYPILRSHIHRATERFALNPEESISEQNRLRNFEAEMWNDLASLLREATTRDIANDDQLATIHA